MVILSLKIMIIMNLLKEYNVFGMNPSETYGPQLQKLK